MIWYIEKLRTAVLLFGCCMVLGLSAGCGNNTVQPKSEPGGVGSIPAGPASELNKLGGVTGPSGANQMPTPAPK